MEQHHSLYKEFKKKFRQSKRLTYLERIAQQHGNTLKDNWKLCKRIRKISGSQKLTFTEDESIVIQEWWQEAYRSNHVETNISTNYTNQIAISSDEVRTILREIGDGKATGPDGIDGELLKYGGERLVQILTIFYSKLWEENKIPNDLKKAYILLLPKRGDSKKPQDLRPITLINALYKIFDKLVTKRLDSEIERKKIMHEAQGGFMENRSCTTQIYAMETVLSYRKRSNLPTYCAFLDLSKAFESIDRGKLFKTMIKRGIDAKIVTIIQEMYRQETSSILFNGKAGELILISKGVRQGGCSSPKCFNLIPNELAIKIEESEYGVRLPNGQRIAILLYADDIILLAPTPGQLQHLCRITEEWLDEYELRINMSKSELVVYNSYCSPKLKIAGEILRVARSYRYLGFVSAKRITGREHLKERALKMEHATGFFLGLLNSIKGIPLIQKTTMAKAYITSVVLYGTDASSGSFEDTLVLQRMEKIQRRYVRSLLGAPANIANSTLLSDLGLISIKGELAKRVFSLRERLELEGDSFIRKIFKFKSGHGA